MYLGMPYIIVLENIQSCIDGFRHYAAAYKDNY